MSISLATKGIEGTSSGTHLDWPACCLASQGILFTHSHDEAAVVEAPPSSSHGIIGGGGGSGWAGERVGWWPIGKKLLDGDEPQAELLSPEESKRLSGEREQELFVVTRIVLEEETYVFDEGAQGEAPRLLAGEVDEEYGSSYVGDADGLDDDDLDDDLAAPPPPSPPDWTGLLVGAALSFAFGSVAGRVHPSLALVVGGASLWAARRRPWAMGGVLIGAPLALVVSAPNTKQRAVASRKRPVRKRSSRKRTRIRMKIQRMRVFGRRK